MWSLATGSRIAIVILLAVVCLVMYPQFKSNADDEKTLCLSAVCIYQNNGEYTCNAFEGAVSLTTTLDGERIMHKYKPRGRSCTYGVD